MPEAPHAAYRPLLLIADDEPFVLDVLAQIAREAGWRVRTVRDGDALLAAAAASPAIDACLLDVRMRGPGCDRLLDRMRRAHPEARLVIMSGDPGTLRGRDADAALAKPFSPGELLGALHAPAAIGAA